MKTSTPAKLARMVLTPWRGYVCLPRICRKCGRVSCCCDREITPFRVHARSLPARSLPVVFCGIAVLQLVQLRVLIVGAKGLGIETAKNLVLAGPAAVTLHDEGVAKPCDLGANFFLRPEHVGTRRAQAVIDQLKALNDDVEIKTSREWLRVTGTLGCTCSDVGWLFGLQGLTLSPASVAGFPNGFRLFLSVCVLVMPICD
jgi:hypothetical protein